MMRKKVYLIMPLVAALSVFSMVEKVVKSETGNDVNKNVPPVVTCYKPMSPKDYEQTLEQLKSSLKSLEDAYNHKLIKEEAYQTRKETLLQKIKDKEE